MKRLVAVLIIIVASLNSALPASAALHRVPSFIGVESGGLGELRTTYALDSLFFYGSGGTGDQSFTPSEQITVTAVLSSGTWHASAPVDEFIIIPNTNDPPDAGGADLDNYYSYTSLQISNISIGTNGLGKSRLTFKVNAPSTWQPGDLTFTAYLDGKCTSIHQAALSETYVELAGVTVMHNGTETLTGAGFTIGNMQQDANPPTMVVAGCYATSLTTVRIQVNESVSEVNGDCGANFSVSGDGISGTIAGTSLASTSSTVWTLTLAGTLPDRDWQGTITYDRDASTNEFRDSAGNEMADGHNVATTSEKIPPANPTLVTPSATADLSGATLSWTGTGNSSSTDPSMASMTLQGSSDGSSWSALSTDSNVADGNYAGSWTIGTQYKYYRLLATDDQSNTSASSSSIDFTEMQRIVLSGTVSQPLDTYEDAITATLTDAYGTAKSGTRTVTLTKVSGSGTVTFRETPEGSNVTSTDIISATSTSFYMASTAIGSHSIRAATAGLLADTLSCTINAGAASQLLVKLPGQTFTSGVGITGTPTNWTAGGGLEFRLYIVDGSNNLISETGARTINFASTAQNSPRNFAPRIDGVIATGWTGRTINFTAGVSSLITANFYNTTGGTLTASDPDGAPALAGVQSSQQGINPAQADYLVFSLDNGSAQSGQAWTGTNTVTVKDFFGNIQTNFNASSNNVTVTSTGGTLDINARGDAVLDLVGDFTSGVADLTALGITLTAADGTYTISGTIAGVVMDWTNTTDSKTIVLNAPTLSNATPAWRSHLNAEEDSPGYMLQANVDENGETLTVYWAFDNDSTKYADYAVQNSAAVITGGGLIQKYITGETMFAQGFGYDYMFWWVGGTDVDGNAPEGKPIAANRMVYVVNPTLTVQGFDIGSGMEPNSVNNDLTRLELEAEMPGAAITVTRISFAKTSSSNATTAHLAAFRLWNDVNANNQYDAGTDTQLGSTVTSTVNPSFTGLSLMVPAGTTVRVILTVSISAAGTFAQTLGMEMPADNYIQLQNSVDNVAAFGDTWPQPGAAADYTLPVEFSLFSGVAGFGENQLSWRTESEVNSLGFRVWRAVASETGVVPAETQFSAVVDWLQLSTLRGRENSSSATDYNFTDSAVCPGVVYCYRVQAVDLDGSSEYHDSAVFVTSLSQPVGYSLDGNSPNPFNPVTSIRFTLPRDVAVKLIIYNMAGALVRTLLHEETMGWGPHVVQWDGLNEQGQSVSSGTYIYQLSTPDFRQARTMLLLR